MIKPIKGTFKTFFDYVDVKGHNDKEFDPNQITNMKTDDKILYLTFDTCPTNSVDYDIVNWLIKNQIQSTIFLNIEWYKNNKNKDLSFLKNDLFTIGGHGFQHIRPMRQNYEEQKRDILQCVDFIKNELDIDIKFYRSPYGRPNEDTINILNELNIKFVSWSGYIFDKTQINHSKPNETSIGYIKKYTMPGDIWIMHINKEGINTFETLKKAFDIVTNKGYQFVKL